MDIHEKKQRLSAMMKHVSLLEPSVDPLHLPSYPGIEHHIVQMPDEYLHLHEAAVIVYHGTIFAAWYNNPTAELTGFTPIRERRSGDGGKTWSEVKTIADGSRDGLLCCPPVFGIDQDRLYLFINRMVSADHIRSLELYQLDESTGEFRFLWSEPIPFKLNTNVYELPDGKLFLAGRIADNVDGFPYYPAGLISDSGRINGKWRPVLFQKSRTLPDGEPIGHAECSAVVLKDRICIFCREDRHLLSLLYRSSDSGETYEGPFLHDIPFSNSKIYSGTLKDGRNYVIGNILHPGDLPYGSGSRSLLAIFFSEPGTMHFTSGYTIHDGPDAALDLYPQWSYPAAYESDGKLYVICTMQPDPGRGTRGAILSILPLS